MINYKSTRGKDTQKYTFSEAILKGLAADGGLLVPEETPTLSLLHIRELMGKTYPERAAFVLKLFQTDLSEETLTRIVNEAYGRKFDDLTIAPVVHLKD